VQFLFFHLILDPRLCRYHRHPFEFDCLEKKNVARAAFRDISHIALNVEANGLAAHKGRVIMYHLELHRLRLGALMATYV
jgi:hypothetical protein